MTKPSFNLPAAFDAFQALEAAVGSVASPQNAEEAARMTALLDELLDAAHAQDAQPGARGLLDLITRCVMEYENDAIERPKFTPVQRLRSLMDANDLLQDDLAELFGGQSVVSAVLNGRRRISLQQAHLLAERFAMDVDAFIDTSPRTKPVVSRVKRASTASKRTFQATTTALHLARFEIEMSSVPQFFDSQRSAYGTPIFTSH